MNFVIIKPAISRTEFLQHLVEQFPEISEDVSDEDYAGLIFLQVGFLARYANNLIQNGRFDALSRVFDFFHATVEQVDSITENALYVSFLEHIEMDEDTPKANKARKLLQPKYLQIWRELRK